MRVRVAYWFGVFFVVLGVLLTAGVISYLPDVLDAGLLLIAGPGMFVLGVLVLGPLPYIIIRDAEVFLPLNWGGKWHRIPRGKNLRVEGDHLIAVRDGRTKAVAKPAALRADAGRSEPAGVSRICLDDPRQPR